MNFGTIIIRWYKKNKRELPWRDTRNPYLIWLSEIILQQTRVEQGLPYYLRFAEKYPNVKSLANAKEDDVLKLWQGLGYYSRARNLYKAAKKIVAEFSGKFPKGSLEIHESIGYADHSLRTFFERAKNEKWYQNTLFIITGDHTSKLESKKYQNQVGRYRVPLLLFSPDQSWEGINAEKVTQHADIPKTILDYVGMDAGDMPATSVSMLSGDIGYALYYADGQDYLFVSKDEVLKFNKNGEQSSYHYNWDTGEITTPEVNQDPILRAYLQYFQNGLISNNLSLYR